MTRRITSLVQIEFKNDIDILKVRDTIRKVCADIGYNKLSQTYILTAISELTRNALTYAKEGLVKLEQVEDGMKIGLMISVIDKGPGISNIELASTDGYSTSGGLGKGLSGTKRLVDDFFIESKVGEGTKVMVIKWKT